MICFFILFYLDFFFSGGVGLENSTGSVGAFRV